MKELPTKRGHVGTGHAVRRLLLYREVLEGKNDERKRKSTTKHERIYSFAVRAF